ncbi:MAG: hypothetical protein HZA93_22155 [Verrucomicrobia bacterium]|nr:hypothetical protein [Verrucomicrobiota bacterium]
MLTRNKHSNILLNQTDHGLQLARLGRLDERPLVVDEFAEFPATADDEAIGGWLAERFSDYGSGYIGCYCGFHPADRLLLRENINTKRFTEPNYLTTLLAETAKLPPLKDWHVAALSAVDGEILSAATPSRSGLLFGLPQSTAREFQNRLRRLKLRPRRIEAGTLPLLGSLSRHLRETAYPHAVVVAEVTYTQTRLYFLAKDGVHTPPALPHGLLSIEETTMKELGAPDIAGARQQLESPTDELRGHARRLVRSITRHLKPAIDYFEMQTGQPIGAFFCGHLPTRMAWLEESLCTAVDLEFLAPPIANWLASAGLALVPDAAPPGRSWFQPLSLVAQIAPLAANESRT